MTTPPYQWAPPPPPHPEANKAMVLGIVALAGGITCYLPIVIAPFAWAIGHRVVKEIDSTPFAQGGRGEAQAGMVMGIIGTVILCLGLGVLILILALASAGTV